MRRVEAFSRHAALLEAARAQAKAEILTGRRRNTA